MLKELIAVVAMFGAAGHAIAPASDAAPPSGFSVVLEHIPNGWAARCESGCRWGEVAFTCASSCGAIVDANGLVTLASARPDSTAFAFVVEWRGDAIVARARSGTAWTTLRWACGQAPCRARVNEAGVGAVSGPR